MQSTQGQRIGYSVVTMGILEDPLKRLNVRINMLGAVVEKEKCDMVG